METQLPEDRLISDINRSHLIIIVISLAPARAHFSTYFICYVRIQDSRTKEASNEDKYEEFDECCQLSTRVPRHKKSHSSKLFTDYSLYGVVVLGMYHKKTFLYMGIMFYQELPIHPS